MNPILKKLKYMFLLVVGAAFLFVVAVVCVRFLLMLAGIGGGLLMSLRVL